MQPTRGSACVWRIADFPQTSAIRRTQGRIRIAPPRLPRRNSAVSLETGESERLLPTIFWCMCDSAQTRSLFLRSFESGF